MLHQQFFLSRYPFGEKRLMHGCKEWANVSEIAQVAEILIRMCEEYA